MSTLEACGGCGEPAHEPNEDCWWQNLGRCPYYAHYRNPEKNPMKPCIFGCWDEPHCITDEPEEGWPGVQAAG